MAETTKTVFGIDLGTTYSCIAYIDQYGKATTLANLEGDRTTPSVIFFDGDNRVVGKEAKNVTMLYPDQVIDMVKRQMGQADWVFFYNGVEYTAEEISSYILRKLADDAEMMSGQPVTDVVITCPAYFGINEREATAKAGEIAGLNVRSIINEPTAAAIAYGLHESQDQTILVYDLGGGTFDITMIEIKKGEINVIATGGDHNLGGRNWDEIIVHYLAEQWSILTGSPDDPLDDMETVQDLFSRAEQAKKALTSREKTDVAVMHSGQRERITLTLEKFDELTANLLERTIEYTKDMLVEAGKKGVSHFDQILLVGGSTKMRQVPIRLQPEFGMEPKLFDPDESVSKGAALFGHKLAIDDEIKIKIESMGIAEPETASMEVVEKARQEVADQLGMALPSLKQYSEMSITNVTSRSFGVEVFNRSTGQMVVSNLIKVNDMVPASTTQQFGTLEDNQQMADIKIMENISSDLEVDPSICEEIGNAQLPLPMGLPADTPIEITFQLDEQGRLHGLARELTHNTIIEVDIQTSRVLSKEQMSEAKKRSTQITIS